MAAAVQHRQWIGVVSGGWRRVIPPPRGFVRFRARYPRLGLIGELNGPVIVTGGGATHAVTDRWQQVGITSYTGRPPLQLTIPLLFDRWQFRETVEQELAALERLHALLPVHHKGTRQSPVVIIEGLGIPHALDRDPSRRWVLTGDPAWDGEDVRYVHGTDRAYQAVTVTAIEWVRPSDELEVADDPTVRDAFRDYYTVPKTGGPRKLKTIARHHPPLTVEDLKRLNPKAQLKIRDPDKELPAGTRVRIA